MENWGIVLEIDFILPNSPSLSLGVMVPSHGPCLVRERKNFATL
jgi:hypothetical protein